MGRKAAAALSGTEKCIAPLNTESFSPPENAGAISSAGGYFTAPALTAGGGVTSSRVRMKSAEFGWSELMCHPEITLAPTSSVLVAPALSGTSSLSELIFTTSDGSGSCGEPCARAAPAHAATAASAIAATAAAAASRRRPTAAAAVTRVTCSVGELGRQYRFIYCRKIPRVRSRFRDWVIIARRLTSGHRLALGERLVADNLEPIAGQVGQARRLVREQDHLAHADVAQNLRADPVVAEVGLGRAQVSARAQVPVAARDDAAAVGVDVARDRVGLALEVEHDAFAQRGNTRHRRLQEASRVARSVAEHVARQIFAMRADAHRPFRIDRAHHQHQVLGRIDPVAIDEGAELAILRRQARLGDPLHHGLVAQPVLDDVGDGDDLESVRAREDDQVVAPRHGAVFLEDLADHARRLEPGQPRQVDAARS